MPCDSPSFEGLIEELAKEFKVTKQTAEKYFKKAEEIVKKEYSKKNKDFYSIVLGITKRMLKNKYKESKITNLIDPIFKLY